MLLVRRCASTWRFKNVFISLTNDRITYCVQSWVLNILEPKAIRRFWSLMLRIFSTWFWIWRLPLHRIFLKMISMKIRCLRNCEVGSPDFIVSQTTLELSRLSSIFPSKHDSNPSIFIQNLHSCNWKSQPRNGKIWLCLHQIWPQRHAQDYYVI